jgi:hypothetical protein
MVVSNSLDNAPGFLSDIVRQNPKMLVSGVVQFHLEIMWHTRPPSPVSIG